jgi:cell wall-associated NlpC family hydrolase
MSTLREICAEAGFHGQALDTAVAVALAESGGRPTAHNGNVGTGDNSYGLFQINMLGTMGPARMKEFGLTSYDQLYDPVINAKAAYRISNGGTNWQPWTTYTGGAYKQHLGADPTNDLASANDGTVHDTASGTKYDEIDSGAPLSAAHSEQDVLISHLQSVLGIEHTTPMHSDATLTHSDDAALRRFIDAAVAQRGDSYVFGAKGGLNDPDPTAFDCSGLTKWAAHKAGYDLPDGAAHQYLALKAQGKLIPVEEAIHTPGALLFHFAAEPQPGGEPEEAHVAISLGNGKTIEAANPDDGVDEFTAGGNRFEYAAVIPGISDGGSSMSSQDHQLTGLSASATPLGTESHETVLMHDLESVLGIGHSGGLGAGLGVDPGHAGSDLDPGHGIDHDIGGHLGDH